MNIFSDFLSWLFFGFIAFVIITTYVYISDSIAERAAKTLGRYWAFLGALLLPLWIVIGAIVQLATKYLQLLQLIK